MGTVGQLLILTVTSIQIYELFVVHFVLLNRLFIDNPLIVALSQKLYSILTLLTMISYFRAVFSDPGSIPTSKEIPSTLITQQWDQFCIKCKYQWKPPRGHHCKSCQKCVFRMDHHCEWINNCVGCYNHKFFILFIIYSFLQSVLTFGLCVSGFTVWASKQQKGRLFQRVFTLSWSRLGFLFLFVASLFFLFFTVEFMTSQISVIMDNQTTVESYKQQFGRPGDFFSNFRQVFGSNPLSWMLPTRPKLEMNYLELVYELEYVEKHSKYLDDDFNNKSSQHYELFQKYQL